MQRRLLGESQIQQLNADYLHYRSDWEKQFLRKFGERTLNHVEAETLTRHAMETLSSFFARD